MRKYVSLTFNIPGASYPPPAVESGLFIYSVARYEGIRTQCRDLLANLSTLFNLVDLNGVMVGTRKEIPFPAVLVEEHASV